MYCTEYIVQYGYVVRHSLQMLQIPAGYSYIQHKINTLNRLTRLLHLFGSIILRSQHFDSKLFTFTSLVRVNNSSFTFLNFIAFVFITYILNS